MATLRLLSVFIAVALGFVAVAYGGAYLVASSRGADSVSPVPLATSDGQAVAARSDIPDADSQIGFWSKRAAGNASAYIDLTYLGQAFARKARETGDVGFYLRAEEALRRALRSNPKYVQATAALSTVLFSLHDFERAIALARPIVEDPRGVQALATLGDASLALGRYAQAQRAYDRLLAWGATPGAYSRLAFLADLRGDTDQALALMDRAAGLAREAGDYGESLAWYAYQIGELSFKAGRIDLAESHYGAALGVFQDYPLALGGLAKVKAARGDYRAAIGHYRRATGIVPQPDLLAALGDVYAALGNEKAAREQYRTVTLIGKLARINRQVYNRQLATFYADHDLREGEARRLALAELRVRRDVYGYDAAAWASYKSGVLEEAARLSKRALSLGTRDSRLYYHAGMIAKAEGRRAEARHLLSEALRMNPHFDLLQARVASAALAELA
ncbi:MAG TPA: tetratricopeptide repeat protein [Gaiellaceae bacterium]|nr:tetratricopeptide repeat protein [Gaiellaceae bacterium]